MPRLKIKEIEDLPVFVRNESDEWDSDDIKSSEGEIPVEVIPPSSEISPPQRPKNLTELLFELSTHIRT